MASHRLEVILGAGSFKSSQLFLHLTLILLFFPFIPAGEECDDVHIGLFTSRVESLWALAAPCSEGTVAALVSSPGCVAAEESFLVSQRWGRQINAQTPTQACLQFHPITMEESLYVGLKYVDPRLLGQMHRIALKLPQDLGETSKSV